MGWTLGIATYFVIWWISLFAVLPFGVKSQHETGDIVPGSESGAPAKPMLLKKVIANTVLAGVIWLVLDFLYIRFYLPG